MPGGWPKADEVIIFVRTGMERMYTSFSERLRIVYQKDCRFFNFERLCNLSERKIMQSFKIKESCNLSDIQYAIFLRKKSILSERKIDHNLLKLKNQAFFLIKFRLDGKIYVPEK